MNIRSVLMLPVMLLAVFCISTFSAGAEELPTSKYEAEGDWGEMHPNAHAKTIAAARAQCDKDADLESADEVTLKHCVVLEHKLVNGLCRNVEVPDGIVHNFINGRNSVSRNKRKATGRDDPALLCDLGDGVYAYWYMMDSEDSCNNIGITITDVKEEDSDHLDTSGDKTPPPSTPPMAEAEECKRYQWVDIPDQNSQTRVTEVDGTILNVCNCIELVDLEIKTSKPRRQVTTRKRVCVDPKPIS